MTQSMNKYNFSKNLIVPIILPSDFDLIMKICLTFLLFNKFTLSLNSSSVSFSVELIDLIIKKIYYLYHYSLIHEELDYKKVFILKFFYYFSKFNHPYKISIYDISILGFKF